MYLNIVFYWMCIEIIVLLHYIDKYFKIVTVREFVYVL